MAKYENRSMAEFHAFEALEFKFLTS